MSVPKPQQRHLTIRGREFHFVSYQGNPGNASRAQLPYPAMWYLMVEGRRCPVLPCDQDQSPADLDLALSSWLEDNALMPADTPILAKKVSPTRPNENWWGPN